MPYLDQSLGKSEVIVARARLAWIYALAAWGGLFAGLLAAALLMWSGSLEPYTTAAAAALVLLGIAAFFAAMLPVWTTEIGVTTQRLIVKRGILGRSTEELELWSIEEVDLRQSAFDRLFGFGRLVIAGTGEDEMVMPLVRDAFEFRKSVQEAINAARPLHQKP